MGSQGVLVVSRDQGTGKSFGERVFSTYPLRFISCDGGDRMRKRKAPGDAEEMCCKNFAAREQVAMYFMIGFGGGYVSGDDIGISLELRPKTTTCIRTQGSTKIFEAVGESSCRQTISAKLEEESVLVYIPDATTCFRGSVFDQKQTFHLKNHSSSCVLVDFYSCGRTNKDEYWHAKRIKNRIEVHIAGKVQLLENMEVENVDHDETTSQKRLTMADRVQSNIFGTVVIFGPRTALLKGKLEGFQQRQSFRDYRMKRQSGDQDDNSFNQTLVSVSTLADGLVVVRFSAVYMEDAFLFLHDTLSPLEEVLGYRPYSDRLHYNL